MKDCPCCAGHSRGLCHGCWLELYRKTPLPKANQTTVRSLMLALYSKVRTGWRWYVRAMRQRR